MKIQIQILLDYEEDTTKYAKCMKNIIGEAGILKSEEICMMQFSSLFYFLKIFWKKGQM